MTSHFRKKSWACFCAAALLAGSAASARAQTVDYGSLESLFGEPVTMSATGQPQKVSDVPVTMEIVTAEDIRRSGATSIPDVLRHRTGMSVWQWTRLHPDVGIRGYNQAFSPRLLVLINGRQVYSDDYGYTPWNTLPIQLEEIRQIEIVRGPNSALFGFNAVAGVINIITYNPLYDQVSSTGIRAGTNGYTQGHGVLTQKIGDGAGVRLSAGGRQGNDFKDPPGFQFSEDPYARQAAADSVIQLTDTSQLRMEASISGTDFNQYVPIYIPDDGHAVTKSARVEYVADTDYGHIQADFYHNTQIEKSSFPVGLERRLTLAQVSDLFRVGTNHHVRLNAEYRHSTLGGYGAVTPGSKIGYDNFALAGMWHWKMRERMTWTNAVRADHTVSGREGPITPNAAVNSNTPFNLAETEYSYNSGIVWTPTELDTFRLMTARGIQSAMHFERGQDVPLGGPARLIGNPLIDPSVITNYELGYDRRIDAINGQFRGGVFYQRTTDVKSLGVLVVGGVTLQPDNIGETKALGMELGLDGAIGEHWTWDTNYTLEGVKDKLTVPAGTPNYNGEQATPEHTVNAHVGYTNGPWEADAFAYHVSRSVLLVGPGGPYTTSAVGDHIGVSGRIGYKITENVTAAVSGQELNHRSVQETSGPKKDRQAFFSLTASF